MGDHEFLQQAEVRSTIEELVELRLQMTEEGRDDAELPDAGTHLAERGIDIPEGSGVRLLRTEHESDVEPMAPLCNGVRALPVNCRMINGRFVCDWVCP